MIADGKDDDGIVRYIERRRLIANMTFKQRETHVILNDDLEKRFKDISNRHASFLDMSTDEKLAEMANQIENMLKKDGRFLSLDYSQICFDYIDEETIKKYRKKIQCFRHSSKESLNDRANFSNEQKSFMIDYGLTILKVIQTLLNDKTLE